MVPAMVWLLGDGAFPHDWVMHTAVATSLTVIFPTAMISAYKHHRKGGVEWSLFWYLAPGLILGAVLGVYLALLLPRDSLQLFFAAFELLIAFELWRGSIVGASGRKVRRNEAVAVGSGIGLVSSILGIGGGTMTVPYLVWRGVPMRVAVGTSAACGLPIAIVGAFGFYYGGVLFSVPENLVQWPVAIIMALSSVIFAPLGVRLAYTLPVDLLRKLFSLLLVLVAISLFF